MGHFYCPTAPVAVHCRDIDFGYVGNKQVLNNLCMSVPKASIYSLLGASSSGKTTLIKIITGLLPADNGEVLVFGESLGSKRSIVPGDGVGYMPQDLCLYPKFSIESTLSYFAQINRMKSSQIKERIKFLQEYLELPDPKRTIGQLSGGQQRRVSLAVALIHSPSLMILDEPTVGIDPVLRSKIWTLLHQLRAKGHTIFVTTHYIEETVASDLIGYMRNGQLICEQNPHKLMSLYGTCYLEDALYDLCRKQDLLSKATNLTEKIDKNKDKSKQSPKCQNRNTFQMSTFVAVAKRTWSLLACDWFNLFIMLIYPSLVLCMISLSFYKLPTVQISASNQDSSYANLSIARQLVNSMSQSVRLNEVNTTEQMIGLIEKGASTAGVSFGSNFSACFVERVQDGIHASDDVLECTQIRAYLDNSHFVNVWLVVFSFVKSFKQIIFDYLPRMGANPRAFLPAIDFLQVSNGEEIEMKFSMESFFITGQITGLNFMLTFLMSGLVWLKDRENGIFERSQVHKVSQLNFLLSHLLVQVSLMLVSNMFFVFVAVLLFGLQLNANLLIAYLLLYLQTVSTILIGQLVAMTSSCHMTYLTKLALVVFPCFFISGSLWPLESINIQFIKSITNILPLTKPTTAFRALISRNLPLNNPLVYNGFLTLACYIILSFGACFIRIHL